MTNELTNANQNIFVFADILNLMQDQPIFFDEEKRLLSKDEVINFKEECGFELKGFVPLVDCYDNDFLFFDQANNNFIMINIVDGSMFNRCVIFDEFYDLDVLKSKSLI